MTLSKLRVEELHAGEGPAAAEGRRVEVHYAGFLTDGTKLESSFDRGKPFSFELGAGHVIRGLEQGIAGMRTGGRRKLTIPPELGYGKRGAGRGIPPNATLIFEVELLGVAEEEERE